MMDWCLLIFNIKINGLIASHTTRLNTHTINIKTIIKNFR
jgi:hypothetical protein